MGRDKAWAPLGGIPMIQRVADRLSEACDEVFVVSKDTSLASLGLRVVPDPRPRDGEPTFHPMRGLREGLGAAAHELCFVCGCDMPFLNPVLIRWQAEQIDAADIVMPELQEAPQALHTIYRRGVTAILDEMAIRGESLWRHMRALRARIVTEAECRAFDPELLSFYSADTPADLARAEEILARGRVTSC
jgi:molybdopterin-guanine dinucleotide biosynthesis protein A